MREHSKIPSPQVLSTVARYPGDMLSSGWKQKWPLLSCSNRHLNPLQDSSNLIIQLEGLLFWDEDVVYLSFSNQGSKEAHECRSWPLLPQLLEKVFILPFFHTSVWVSTREVRLCPQARLDQTREQERCRSPMTTRVSCWAGAASGKTDLLTDRSPPDTLVLGVDFSDSSTWHYSSGNNPRDLVNILEKCFPKEKGVGSRQEMSG